MTDMPGFDDLPDDISSSSSQDGDTQLIERQTKELHPNMVLLISGILVGPLRAAIFFQSGAHPMVTQQQFIQAIPAVYCETTTQPSQVTYQGQQTKLEDNELIDIKEYLEKEEKEEEEEAHVTTSQDETEEVQEDTRQPTSMISISPLSMGNFPLIHQPHFIQFMQLLLCEPISEPSQVTYQGDHIKLEPDELEEIKAYLKDDDEQVTTSQDETEEVQEDTRQPTSMISFSPLSMESFPLIYPQHVIQFMPLLRTASATETSQITYQGAQVELDDKTREDVQEYLNEEDEEEGDHSLILNKEDEEEGDHSLVETIEALSQEDTSPLIDLNVHVSGSIQSMCLLPLGTYALITQQHVIQPIPFMPSELDSELALLESLLDDLQIEEIDTEPRTGQGHIESTVAIEELAGSELEEIQEYIDKKEDDLTDDEDGTQEQLTVLPMKRSCSDEVDGRPLMARRISYPFILKRQSSLITHDSRVIPTLVQSLQVQTIAAMGVIMEGTFGDFSSFRTLMDLMLRNAKQFLEFDQKKQQGFHVVFTFFSDNDLRSLDLLNKVTTHYKGMIDNAQLWPSVESLSIKTIILDAQHHWCPGWASRVRATSGQQQDYCASRQLCRPTSLLVVPVAAHLLVAQDCTFFYDMWPDAQLLLFGSRGLDPNRQGILTALKQRQKLAQVSGGLITLGLFAPHSNIAPNGQLQIPSINEQIASWEAYSAKEGGEWAMQFDKNGRSYKDIVEKEPSYSIAYLGGIHDGSAKETKTQFKDYLLHLYHLKKHGKLTCPHHIFIPTSDSANLMEKLDSKIMGIRPPRKQRKNGQEFHRDELLYNFIKEELKIHPCQPIKPLKTFMGAMHKSVLPGATGEHSMMEACFYGVSHVYYSAPKHLKDFRLELIDFLRKNGCEAQAKFLEMQADRSTDEKKESDFVKAWEAVQGNPDAVDNLRYIMLKSAERGDTKLRLAAKDMVRMLKSVSAIDTQSRPHARSI